MKQKSSFWVLLLFALTFACKPLPVLSELGSQTQPQDNQETDNDSTQENNDNDSGNTNQQKDKPDMVLAKSVVAYYTFNEGNAKSQAGNAYHGVLFGEPSFIDDTPDGNGKALMLNGVKEQCVNIPYNLFADLQHFTISLWMKDFYAGAVISAIYASSYNNNVFQYYPRIYLTEDEKFSFVCDSYGLESAPAFSYRYVSIQSDGWHHIATVCQEGNLLLYVDGEFVDRMTDRWNNPGQDRPKVQLGGNGNGVFPVFFSGKLDNVGIYSEGLDAEVIKYIYQNRL